MSFDALAVLEETGGMGLAEGWNSVAIEEVMQKTSSRGNAYVSVTLAGRGGKLWVNLNINHPNPKADEIARRELAGLMIACGVNSVRDPANPVELVGKTCQALVEPDGSFMRAKQFKPLERAQPQAQPTPRGMQAADLSVPNDDIPF